MDGRSGTPPVADSVQKPNRSKAVVVNILLRSTDGGQTWQDISEGLPDNLRGDEFQGDGAWRDPQESSLYHRASAGCLAKLLRIATVA